MPLDAVCLSGVVKELRESLLGLRVEKVQQPARDQVVLTLRGNKKLLLCAGASQARVHLTSAVRENPASPPMFCMLLRKHLTGGRLAAIDQPALERAVILTLDIVDELGEPGQRKLVAECMGRYSNLILLDGEDRIIDCLRRVDMEMSERRQVLPGLFYHLPPAQEKADPLAVEPEEFARMLDQANPDREASGFLLDSFFGLSPLVCRELADRAGGDRPRGGPLRRPPGGVLRLAGAGEGRGVSALYALEGGEAVGLLLPPYPPVRRRYGAPDVGGVLPHAGRLL